MSKNYYNYGKHAVEKTENSEVKEQINETVDICVDDSASSSVPEPEDKEPEITFGVVSNCEKLNLREKPSKDAEVICMLDAGTELMIDVSESNDEWLSVYNTGGLKGFCMKNFVTVK